MTSVSIFLALVFGGIAIWAAIRLIKIIRKPASRPHVIERSPADPWGAGQMRRRERDSQK